MITIIALAIYGTIIGEATAALWDFGHKGKAIALPVIGFVSMAVLVFG